MRAVQSTPVALSVIASVVTVAALSAASTVFAPLALALLIIAILWPLQKKLQSIVPKGTALAITALVLIVSISAFGFLMAWSLGRVGQALMNDAARFQQVYEQLIAWLERHGIAVAALGAEHINVSWVVRLVQTVLARLNSAMSFLLIVIVYVLLGLLEVDAFANNIGRIENTKASRVLLDGNKITAAKIRSYFLIRTQMSVITGLLVLVVCYALQVPLAIEWGVLTFVLNYIPFLGPLISTLLLSVFAIAEFQSWQTAALLFVVLNVIQIAIGSYVEPRVSGNKLSISPLLVFFSVFFWTFLWGLFGAFIGVPFTIAILTYCEQNASTRWIANLFSGADGGRPL